MFSDVIIANREGMENWEQRERENRLKEISEKTLSEGLREG